MYSVLCIMNRVYVFFICYIWCFVILLRSIMYCIPHYITIYFVLVFLCERECIHNFKCFSINRTYFKIVNSVGYMLIRSPDEADNLIKLCALPFCTVFLRENVYNFYTLNSGYTLINIIFFCGILKAHH